jgi:hypothetical protein
VTETKPAAPTLNNKKNVQDKPIKTNSRLYNKIEQDTTLFYEPERHSPPFLSRASRLISKEYACVVFARADFHRMIPQCNPKNGILFSSGLGFFLFTSNLFCDFRKSFY